MANLVWAKEIAGREGSLNEQLDRTYRRRYLAKFDSRQASAIEAFFASGIPQIYDAYTAGDGVDLGSVVKSISPRQMEDNPFLWEIDIEYGSLSADPTKQDENPLERPPDVRWSSERVEEVLQGAVKPSATDDGEEEYFSGPLRNSNYDPFDPQPTRQRSIPTLQITKNYAQVDPLFLLSLADVVNSDSPLGAAPRTLKLSVDEVRGPIIEHGYRYFAVTYIVQFKFETWDLRILDHGPRHKLNDGGDTLKNVSFLTEDRTRTTGNLDGEGYPLEEGADPVFLRFKAFPEYPLATLDIWDIFT